jgi:hypothetical protein
MQWSTLTIKAQLEKHLNNARKDKLLLDYQVDFFTRNNDTGQVARCTAQRECMGRIIDVLQCKILPHVTDVTSVDDVIAMTPPQASSEFAAVTGAMNFFKVVPYGVMATTARTTKPHKSAR